MPLPNSHVSSAKNRWLVFTILLSTSVLLAFAVERISKAGEQPSVEDVDQLAAENKWKYLGADRCERCHNEDASEKIDRSWSAQNEFALWHQDMHSKAYKNLENELGQRMGKLLGGIDVTKDDRCLSCHAMPVKEELRGDNFSLADGVSCDACHGPAREWMADHAETSWRTKSPAEKAALGMRDLRNPAIQVKLCASCHIGDAAKDRVVTHEMYMAGHPPLPSLEPVNFSKVLKQHWQNLDKKDPKVQKEVNYPPGRHRQSELYLTNGVAALLTSAQLLAREAAGADESHPWPHLAQFDCASCHHDLRAPSRDWRSAIPNPVGPGMPDLATWPRIMTRLAIFHAEESPSALEERLQSLDSVLAQRPYGEVQAIPNAANAVTTECQRILATLDEKSFDDEAVLRTFRQLAEIGASQPVDYETARQLAWGARVFAEDLGENLPNRDAIQASLDALASGMYLDLPGGSQESMWTSLPSSLSAASSYHPDAFRREMSRIASALSAQ